MEPKLLFRIGKNETYNTSNIKATPQKISFRSPPLPELNAELQLALQKKDP